MKNPIRSLLVVVSLLAGTLGIAQAQNPDFLKVNVPFDFVAGNKTLPAGEYHLLRVNENNPSLLRMTNAQGDFAFLSIMHNEGLATAHTRFVFRNSSESYVLTALRTAHETYDLHNSRADRTRNVATTEYSISGIN